MSDENFANYPKSLAEIRAEKENNGARWNPRDALIDLLRQIDEGTENPYALVIVWATAPTDAGGDRTTWSSACPDSIVATGMLSRTIHRMHICATEE